MGEEIIEKDMTPVLLEDLGLRFTTEKSKQKNRFGLYKCSYCGKEFEARIADVKLLKIKSCGCQSPRYKNPHGLTNHILYNVWNGMRKRCYNAKELSYPDYGARGIKVCERWLDIKNFIEDMYPSYEVGLSLDRIDVDGDYEPDNCRWTTLSIQSQNTREIRSNNTSGFRGVSWASRDKVWLAQITVNNRHINLGTFQTALEAAKAYERYIRLNNLEHNFTPVLTGDEIEELNKGIK